MKCAPARSSDGGAREVTNLKGVENFGLSPDNGKLLLRYSTSYMPAQLATISCCRRQGEPS